MISILGKVWLCPKCLSNLEAGIFCEWCERFVNIDEAFETDNELTLCADCKKCSISNGKGGHSFGY